MLPLTPVLLIVRVLASVRAVSDKVLAVLTYSMLNFSARRADFCGVFGINKAHEGLGSAAVTTFLSMRTLSTAGPPSWTAAISRSPRKSFFVCSSAYCRDSDQGGNRYDNAWAIKQIEEGHNSVLSRKPATNAHMKGLSKRGKTLPRVITLGGDHTITLPLLRSINREYGPVSVIHFDSHL